MIPADSKLLSSASSISRICWSISRLCSPSLGGGRVARGGVADIRIGLLIGDVSPNTVWDLGGDALMECLWLCKNLIDAVDWTGWYAGVSKLFQPPVSCLLCKQPQYRAVGLADFRPVPDWWHRQDFSASPTRSAMAQNLANCVSLPTARMMWPSAVAKA